MSQDFEVLGRISNSSNLALLVDNGEAKFIYKPISGERELWDFPTGSLALREVAAFRLCDLLGWNFVPNTFLADGPNGPGSFQEWVSHNDDYPVDVFRDGQVPPNYLSVLKGLNEANEPVTLAHENSLQLARIALFDVLANNADRKAGHLLSGNQLWAIDHGVTFHEEPKLRTVLWGWAGLEIPSELLAQLTALVDIDLDFEFAELLADFEIVALRERLARLIEIKEFPVPSADWPAIPWPIF